MATEDQRARLEALWKLTNEYARDDLKALYDKGDCLCEINVGKITRQFTKQWGTTNKAAPSDETRKEFQNLARAIRNAWAKKVRTGTLKHKGSVVVLTSIGGSGTQTLKFTMTAGKSKADKRNLASNNYKLFKNVTAEIFEELANGSFKKLFTGYKRNEVGGGLRSPIDIGHVNSLGSAGRASTAAGILEGLDLSNLDPELQNSVERAKDSLLTLGLSDTNEQVVHYNQGKLTFTGTQSYTLEASSQNKGANRKKEKEEEDAVVEVLTDLLGDNAADIKEFINQKGSPSMIDVVGDMIVNTPIKKRAYKTRKGKNLSKYKKPLNAKSSSKTLSKEEKFKGSTVKASFGLDSGIAMALPRAARPGKQTEGGSGQTPEDFAQKIRGLLKVKRAINQRLPAEVRRNMGSASTLNNRTGRFSNSAEVTEILPAAQTLMVKYSYRLDPYETFENKGKRRWPAGYNPKPLIAKSIRGLALGLVDEKLTIRRA
jgi:hypothetical protein